MVFERGHEVSKQTVETDSQPGLENELDVGGVVGRDVAIIAYRG
jgi:hypothetical protein